MSAPRFFCRLPLVAGTVVELPAQAAHHAMRVLRLRQGDAVTLFTGEGGEFSCTIEKIQRHSVRVDVQTWEDRERESPLDVTLVQALSTHDKIDLVLQKATELGVRRLVIVHSARSVVNLTGERARRRLERWRQILIGACEQCGRNRVPELLLAPLTDWLRDSPPVAHRFILTPAAPARLADLSQPQGAVQLLIGPEGGFTEQEQTAAIAAGFTPLRMGPRTLRTETAGPAALAALQALWGDG